MPIKFLYELDSISKLLNILFHSCHRNYYVSLTQSTRTITWVPVFSALLETVEWRWLSQIFLVSLCLHSRTRHFLKLKAAFSKNLKILFITPGSNPILALKMSIPWVKLKTQICILVQIKSLFDMISILSLNLCYILLTSYQSKDNLTSMSTRLRNT